MGHVKEKIGKSKSNNRDILLTVMNKCSLLFSLMNINIVEIIFSLKLSVYSKIKSHALFVETEELT